MTHQLANTTSNRHLRSGEGRDTTPAVTMSSRCSDDNPTPCRHPSPYRPTDSAPRSRSHTSASSLASLTVLAAVVVVVAGLAGPVEARLMGFSAPEVIQYGTCAQPKDQRLFNFRQFKGLWYQVEMVPNSYMEAKKCITLYFDWDGEAYNVTTKGLNEYNEEVQQNAMITQQQPQDPSTSRPYLKIRASGVPPVPYHVVKTDYRRFACVYSCFELFNLMFEAFSVLSRNAEVDEFTHQACHRAFAALDLDLTRLEPVYQEGLCLGEGLQGSGEEPPRWDEEDENALVALTSEEVNLSGAPNAASDPRSGPTVEEDEAEALMEELLEEEARELKEEEEEEEEEEEVQENDVIEAQAEETGERQVGDEIFSFLEIEFESSSNQTEGDARELTNRTSEISDLEGKVTPSRKPKKGHGRKRTKGERRRGKERGQGEERRHPETSRDQELYLDDVQMDSLYYPEEEERGGGGGGGDGRDEASLPTSDHLGPYDGAGGGVRASLPLLLLALLTLALSASVSPKS